MDNLLIRTERLEIRNLQLTDLQDFHSYRSNPDVTKYQGFDLMTLEQADEFINFQKDKLFGQPGEWVQYGIEDISIKKLVGDCAIKLELNDPRIAEIGITVSNLYQKRGYAKEALTGILNWLFQTKQILRVVETVDVENNACIELLECLGFRKEGHFIENTWHKGKWGSEFQYAMLKREWE